jgi:exonuclease SbcD
MRILHTSDWHVGRTFHGHQTLDHLELVLTELAEVVANERVDVVVVAGDVFDLSVPSGAAMELLGRALGNIIRAGAQIVLTSGNHDSAARLGYLSGFTSAGGLHIFADPGALGRSVSISDPADGEVLFFGIPFLEPVMVRHLAPELDLRSQADVIGYAMAQIRQKVPQGARYVVLAHTFAVPGTSDIMARSDADQVAEARNAPRDFTRGGIDSVPAGVFDGATYVALGHLHSRSQWADNVRYSGAPLHYSFGEAGRARGAWLVDIAADGGLTHTWIDLPIPRELRELVGELNELLSASEYDKYKEHWIKAVLTDDTRPIDAMRVLQQRFPNCAEIEYRPKTIHSDKLTTYAERIKQLSDQEITSNFLAHVRNGDGPSAAEEELIAELIRSVVS